MTKTVDVKEAQTHLPELLSLALRGDEVIITEDDKPLARLVPVSSEGSRVAGLNRGSILAGDDFDEPLPDDFWLGDDE